VTISSTSLCITWKALGLFKAKGRCAGKASTQRNLETKKSDGRYRLAYLRFNSGMLASPLKREKIVQVENQVTKTYESREIFGICMTYLGSALALRLGGERLAALVALGLRLRLRDEVEGLLLDR
jgi:hypothetical protein